MGAVLGHLKLYRSNLQYANGELEQTYNPREKGRPSDTQLLAILDRSKTSYQYIDTFESGFIFFLQLIFEVGDNWSLVYPIEKVLTSEIVEQINKKGTLVLGDSESYDYSFNKVVNRLLKLGINLDKVIYISSSYKSDPRVKCFFLEQSSWFDYYSNRRPTLDIPKPSKTFNFLNGRTTSIHKMLLFNAVEKANLLDDCSYSLYKIQGKERFFSKDIRNRVPISTDLTATESIEDVGLKLIENNLFTKGCVSILVTAHYFDARKRQPEAVILDLSKTCTSLRPFLVFSNFVDYDKVLHDLGYKTYSNIFDESFYSEPDILKRVRMFVAEMQRIKTLNHDYILRESRKINLHNLKNYWNNNSHHKAIVECLTLR